MMRAWMKIESNYKYIHINKRHSFEEEKQNHFDDNINNNNKNKNQRNLIIHLVYFRKTSKYNLNV